MLIPTPMKQESTTKTKTQTKCPQY